MSKHTPAKPSSVPQDRRGAPEGPVAAPGEPKGSEGHRKASRQAFEAWWHGRDPSKIGDTNAILAWITWREAQDEPLKEVRYLKKLICKLIEDASPDCDPSDPTDHLALMLEAANAVSDHPVQFMAGSGVLGEMEREEGMAHEATIRLLGPVLRGKPTGDPLLNLAGHLAAHERQTRERFQLVAEMLTAVEWVMEHGKDRQTVRKLLQVFRESLTAAAPAKDGGK